jgi:hypothetical protein
MSVIRKIEETQTILLEALQDPHKLETSSLTQISDVLRDISTTQLNLLNASRSAEALIREVDPTALFSGDELEYMALLSRRLSSPTALPSGSSGGIDLDSEFQPEPTALEAEYDLSPSSEEVDISDGTTDPGDSPSSEENLNLLKEFAHTVMKESEK